MNMEKQEGECPCKAAKRDCFDKGEKIYTGKCVETWDACAEKRKLNPDRDESWPMCSMAKARCMRDGEKNLKGRCGSVWEWCDNEVKAHEVDAKDCYFDKECHEKVNWTLIEKYKGGIFA